MSQSAEHLLRSFEAQAREHAERAQELSRRLEHNAVTAESADGEVRVTVDSTGGLADLRFGSAARGVGLDRLAELVLATSRTAQARLAESMGELVSDLYGRGSPTASFVTQTYAQRFPAPDDEGEQR